MHPPSRRGNTQGVFSRTSQDVCSGRDRGPNTDTARQQFGPAHNVIRDNQQPCEQDSAIPKPRPTKLEAVPQICYLLFAILKASMPSPERLLRRTHNPGKTVCVQAGAANQRAVNVWLAHQLFGVLGFNTSTLLNPYPISSGLIKELGKQRPQKCVNFLCLGWSGGAARADRPNRLVSQNHLRQVIRGNPFQ